MALERFQQFLSAAAGVTLTATPHGEPQEVNHVGRFLQKMQRKALIGVATVAGAAALATGSLAVPGVGLHIHENTLADTVYQTVQAHMPGHALANEQHVNEAHDFIREAQHLGMLKVLPTFTVSALNADDASRAIVHDDQSCSIQLAMDSNGAMGSLGPIMTGVDGAFAKYHREAIVAHESSHCSIVKEANPFRHSGLSAETESYVNQWLMRDTVGPAAAAYKTLNETQADVRGQMIMLHANHFSDEAWASVKKDYQDRLAEETFEEQQGMSFAHDPHNTAPGLRRLLDQRATVEHLPTDQYGDFALGIASQSLMETFDGATLRASPIANVAPSDREAAPSYLGKQGYEQMTAPLSVDGMREAVREAAMDLQEERLGLKNPPALANTLPREVAAQWLDKDHPLRDLTITTVNGSLNREWASPVALRKFEESYAGIDSASGREVRKRVDMVHVKTELAHALHVDDAVLANVKEPVVSAPSTVASVSRVPFLGALGDRIAARLKAVETTIAPAIATVQRRVGL